MMNHTGLWYAELGWYSLNATLWICRLHESDEPHWTVRWWARLILSECYSVDLLRSWRWPTTLDCEMASSPDTLRVLPVSVRNHYHINGLHLFWDSFDWFCLQISSDTKYCFLPCPRHFDRRLIAFIVWYYQIWNRKGHNIIINRFISSQMSLMYIETPYINLKVVFFIKHALRLKN